MREQKCNTCKALMVDLGERKKDPSKHWYECPNCGELLLVGITEEKQKQPSKKQKAQAEE